MSEPASTVAGSIAGYKLMLLGLPVVAAIAGFWLGLRFVPLRKGYELDDVTNRMTACAVSSFVLGIPALILLQQHAPGSVVAMQQLAHMVGLQEGMGVLILAGCMFLVCSVPGPWLIAAVFLYMERRKGKDIKELVNEVRGQEGNKASNKASSMGGDHD
ncbi:MAG: hypothetical protein RR584_11500 [Comamonas sp.]